MQTESKSRYLDSLQLFRGIAALMVVLHHAVGSLNYYHHINNPFLDLVGKFGKFGVDFFFILSGFIISYASFHKYNNPSAFQNYIKNRVIRIYIPYLPIGIAMYILYAYFPFFSNSTREISLFTTLTLFPSGNPALSVAWTLTFELLFYCVFSISFFSRKAWNCFVLLWALSILLFHYTSIQSIAITQSPILNMFLSPYNIEFILGYLLSWIIIHNIKIRSKYLVVIFTLLFFLFLNFRNFKFTTLDFYLNYLFSCMALLILYLVISRFTKKVEENSIMMLVGNASYSIYLIHNPLQMLIIRLFPKINSLPSLMLSLALVLFLSSIFGYLYYLTFEKKCMNFIKSKIIS
jgi:peptidoglycan/LPS O-acetylase OafA/YrhL